MILFYKHLWRSVRRSPAQSVIIAFTLFLATLMFVFSFVVMGAVGKEQQMQKASTYGRANVSVTLSASSSARFLTASSLRGLTGEGDVVSGYYALPVSFGEEGAVWGAAADFYTIDRLFDLSFTAYGTVTEATLNTSAFVTEAFAAAHGLRTGDTFTVELLSVQKQYTVQGVGAYPFFGQYDFLVNASGAVAILAAQVPALAAFDGDDLPYSALFVRLEEENGAAALAEKLQNSAAYAGQIVAVHGENASEGYLERLLAIMQTVMTALSACIAAVIVYCSVNILARKRAEETESFLLAGAPPAALRFALFAEMAVYLLVGALFGVPAAGLLLGAVSPSIGFTYASVRLTPVGALFGTVAEILVGLAALCFHAVGAGKRTRQRPRLAVAVPLVALVFTIAPCICLIFAPLRTHYVFAFWSGIGLVWLILSGVPVLLGGGMRKMGGAVDGVLRSAPVRYAVKNTARVKELHNACRLLCVVVAAVIGMTVCFRYGNRQLNVSDSLFDCDYVAVNASAASRGAIENLQATQGSCSAYLAADACFADGKNITLLSVESAAYIGADYAPEALPQGNGLLLPQATAALYGLSVGDAVTVFSGGKAYEFTLAGVTEGASYCGYFDSLHFGLPHNLLLIRSEATDAAYKAALSRILAADLALLTTPSSLLRGQEWLVYAYLGALSVFFACNVVISVVGVAELVWFGYARRKGEFASYALCGMSRAERGKMIVAEILLFAAVAALVSAAGGALFCVWINGGMASFGYSLF